MEFIRQDQKLNETNYDKVNTFNYKNLKMAITIIKK